jgi:hypothetical protein
MELLLVAGIIGLFAGVVVYAMARKDDVKAAVKGFGFEFSLQAKGQATRTRRQSAISSDSSPGKVVRPNGPARARSGSRDDVDT